MPSHVSSQEGAEACDTQRRRRQCDHGDRDRMMWPQVKECWGPLAAGTGKEQVSPRVPGGRTALSTPGFGCTDTNFRFVAFRTVKESVCVVLSYSICGSLLQQPRKIIQS